MRRNSLLRMPLTLATPRTVACGGPLRVQAVRGLQDIRQHGKQVFPYRLPVVGFGQAGPGERPKEEKENPHAQEDERLLAKLRTGGYL